jgi:hypothetical protein
MSTIMGKRLGGSKQGCAVVTGASSGIGAAYAQALAAHGYDLVLVARRRERLEAKAEHLRRQTGIAVEVLPADLSDVADLQRVKARVAAHDGLTLLVNNAGLGDLGDLAEVPRATVTRMIAVNVTALTTLTQAALPGMIRQRAGTVINIASGLAFDVLKGFAVYGGTKAYVVQFTRLLAEEVREHGIRLQALVPGLTRTELGGAADSGSFDRFPPEFVMSPEDLVAASLAGLELGELVCIPRLLDAGLWDRASEQLCTIGKSPPFNKPAPRYGVV